MLTKAQIIQTTAYALSIHQPLPNDIPHYGIDYSFSFSISLPLSRTITLGNSIIWPQCYAIVDWGDGAISNFTEHEPDYPLDYQHRYAQGGIYTIEIAYNEDTIHPTEIDDQFNMKQIVNTDYLISVNSVLPVVFDKIESFEKLFYYCENLTLIPPGLFDHCPLVTSFEGCFYNCKYLTLIPSRLFKRSSLVTSFKECFYGCDGLDSIPEGLFDDCPLVTDFTRCFYGCTGITSSVPELWVVMAEIIH